MSISDGNLIYFFCYLSITPFILFRFSAPLTFCCTAEFATISSGCKFTPILLCHFLPHKLCAVISECNLLSLESKIFKRIAFAAYHSSNSVLCAQGCYCIKKRSATSRQRAIFKTPFFVNIKKLSSVNLGTLFHGTAVHIELKRVIFCCQS